MWEKQQEKKLNKNQLFEISQIINGLFSTLLFRVANLKLMNRNLSPPL